MRPIILEPFLCSLFLVLCFLFRFGGIPYLTMGVCLVAFVLSFTWNPRDPFFQLVHSIGEPVRKSFIFFRPWTREKERGAQEQSEAL